VKYKRRLREEQAECLHCGEAFMRGMRKGQRAQFCSVKCRTYYFRERKEPIEKSCPFCGHGFKTQDPKQVYCSRPCASKAQQVREGNRLRAECTCKRCGKTYVPRQMAYDTFCTRECAFAWHRQERAKRRMASRMSLAAKRSTVRTFQCVICGRDFQGDYRRYSRKFCSDTCNNRAYLQGRIIRQCAVCEKDYRFGDQGTSTRFCSPLCQSEGYRQAKRESKRRRRAMKKGARCEPYKRRDIFERDGWTCKVCGEKVNRRTVAPHPKAPTIDHIVPLSKGGADAPDNVQCAHARCNTVKSDNLGYQRPLFV